MADALQVAYDDRSSSPARAGLLKNGIMMKRGLVHLDADLLTRLIKSLSSQILNNFLK